MNKERLTSVAITLANLETNPNGDSDLQQIFRNNVSELPSIA